MKPILKKSLIGIGVTLLLVVVGLVVAGIALFGGLNAEARSVASELKLARSVGIPESPAQLLASGGQDIDDNAALLLKQLPELLAQCEENVDTEGLKAALDGTASRADRDEVLQHCEPIIDLIRSAAKRDDFLLSQAWEDGPLLRNPIYAAIEVASRLACLQAEQHAENGKWREAREVLQSVQRIGLHISADPTYDGLLTSINTEFAVLNAVAVLAVNHRTQEAIQLGTEILQSSKPVEPMPAILGESSLTLMVGADPDKYREVLPEELQKVIDTNSQVSKAMNAKLIHRHRTYVERLKKHVNDIEQMLAQATEIEGEYEPSKKPTDMLASMFPPAASHVLARAAELEDAKRLLGAALDVLKLAPTGNPEDTAIQRLESIQAIHVQRDSAGITLSFARPNRRPISLNLSQNSAGFQFGSR
ncbi:hypothetical protein QPK87_30955 [Kamptonema cortianum]|nr:hypothetical protein [Geitlerinema splendidum]MDK3160945.1 hypothetical protein [Kamptonema cortianum]